MVRPDRVDSGFVREAESLRERVSAPNDFNATLASWS